MNTSETTTPETFAKEAGFVIALDITCGMDPSFHLFGINSAFASIAIQVGLQTALDVAGISLRKVGAVGECGDCVIIAKVTDLQRGLDIFQRVAKGLVYGAATPLLKVGYYDERELIWRCTAPESSLPFDPLARLEQRAAAAQSAQAIRDSILPPL